MIQPGFPQVAVARDPAVELTERRRPQRVQPARALRPDLDESGLAQNPQVPGHAGLVDVDALDDVVHRALAVTQDVDDAAARRIREDFERVDMHDYTYA